MLNQNAHTEEERERERERERALLSLKKCTEEGILMRSKILNPWKCIKNYSGSKKHTQKSCLDTLFTFRFFKLESLHQLLNKLSSLFFIIFPQVTILQVGFLYKLIQQFLQQFTVCLKCKHELASHCKNVRKKQQLWQPELYHKKKKHMVAIL